MKPLNYKYIIQADTSQSDTVNVIGLDGLPLAITKNFNPYAHNTQFGVVYEVPIKQKNDLKAGDKVFFHHLVTDPKNKVIHNGEDFYFADWDTIYAKIIDDKLIPLQDIFFAERIPNNELERNGIILQEYAENIHQIVKVISTNELVREQGINDGDIIVTVENAGVPIKDSNLVWLKLINVFGVVRNNELIPIKDKAIIMESITNEETNIRFGMIVSNFIGRKFLKGVLMHDFDDLHKGTIVSFIHGAFTRLVWNDNKYAVCGREDLIMIN